MLPADKGKRSDLENELVNSANIITYDGQNCLNKEQVETFSETWRELVDYYENHDDNDIGVEVIREFIDWQMRFSTVWHDETRPANCREAALDPLEELELLMNNIIRAVEMRLYPTGR